MAAALKLDYSYQIEENDKKKELIIERIRKFICENGIPQKAALKEDFGGNPPEKNDGKRVKTTCLEEDSKYILDNYFQ